MEFTFSEKNQNLIVFHYNKDGLFSASTCMLIEANTGLPANSTIEPLPELLKGQCAVYKDDQWQVLSDYRNQMCYAKDRDKGKDYLVTELGELPDSHTLIEPGQYDYWLDRGWHYDEPRYRLALKTQEANWSKAMLQLVDDEVAKCQRDQFIPEIYSELKTTNYTEQQYYELLMDRKLLNEYVLQTDFPECGRPTLSGLV